MELRAEDVQKIVRIFADSEMEELRLDLGGSRLHLSKSVSGAAGLDDVPTQVPPTAPATLAETAAVASAGTSGGTSADRGTGAEDGMHALRSPLLGVFYRRPSPDDAPFVEVGDEVTADDPVCVIEVMKMYTQVPAGIRGRVAEICVEDGQLVETGQILLRIDPQ